MAGLVEPHPSLRGRAAQRARLTTGFTVMMLGLTPFWVWSVAATTEGGLASLPGLAAVATTVGLLAVYALARSRHAYWGGLLACIILVAAISFLRVTEADPDASSRSYFFFVLPILLASLLLGPWWAVGMFLLTTAAAVLLEWQFPVSSLGSLKARINLVFFGLATTGLAVVFAFVSRADQRTILERDERLRTANAGLERRVQERTAELQAAKEAAERASATKSIFLASMSHELRTPLHAIVNGVDALERAGADPSMAAMVRQGADDLLWSIGSVLDFSALESGGLLPEQAPFSPTDVVRQAVALIEPRLRSKNLRLVLATEDLPERVVGDGWRVGQALRHLAHNAAKFTSQGSIAIEGRAEPDAAGLVLRFRVKDTGPGIPPEAQSRLYDPFMQVEQGRQRRHDGAGLGLPLCRALARAMGGDVRLVESSAAGTTMELWVRVQPAAAGPAAADGVRLEGRRVLVVEDNATNRKVASRLLETLGIQVELAEDGAQAVERVVAAGPGRFDAVLMDLHMPVMDGFEATAAIRAAFGAAAPPVVAMTADVLPETRRRCQESGMCGFLPKPTRREELRACLAQALAPQSRITP